MISWFKRKRTNATFFTSSDDINSFTAPSSAAPCLEPKTFSPEMEVEHYKRRLSQFGVDISHMPKYTPPTKKKRKDAYMIAHYIANDIESRTFFLKSKKLPITQLLKKFPKKSMKQNSHYIIATALIVIEDYHYLKGYLPE